MKVSELQDLLADLDPNLEFVLFKCSLPVWEENEPSTVKIELSIDDIVIRNNSIGFQILENGDL